MHWVTRLDVYDFGVYSFVGLVLVDPFSADWYSLEVTCQTARESGDRQHQAHSRLLHQGSHCRGCRECRANCHCAPCS